MSQLKGIYALWYREYKVFLREKSRVVASIVNPILWFLVIGGGIGSAVDIQGVNYQTFIYPGVLIQAVLFSSIFYGVYIVWDKKIDFLKEVLVSPLSRTGIFLGKIAGGSTDTILQIAILLLVGYGFAFMGLMPGIRPRRCKSGDNPCIHSCDNYCICLYRPDMGSQMESPGRGFRLVSSFVVLPYVFLSGAFFPINNLPVYLSPFVYINPITYSVDGMRGALIGESVFPMGLDLAVVSVFAAAMIVVGTHAFSKMKL